MVGRAFFFWVRVVIKRDLIPRKRSSGDVAHVNGRMAVLVEREREKVAVS
mgnify:CR=1 FL=1